MQIGFNLPISGPMSTPEIVTWIAQEGEAMGYDYLTLTDHILLPNFKVPGYPYSESGEFFTEGPQNRHDQLTAASYIAANTLISPASSPVASVWIVCADTGCTDSAKPVASEVMTNPRRVHCERATNPSNSPSRTSIRSLPARNWPRRG